MNADIFNLIALKCDIRAMIQLKSVNKNLNRWLSHGPAAKHMLQLKNDYLMVKRNGRKLKYVKNQTYDICLTAIKQDASAFMYVKNQTDEICMAAVKLDERNLKYIKNQTYDICMEVVRNHGYALRYVKENDGEKMSGHIELMTDGSDDFPYFDDWEDFMHKLATESPFDIQLFIEDEGNRMNWYNQGMAEIFYERDGISPTEFKEEFREYVTNELKNLNEDFEYELENDYKANIDLFVDYAAALHLFYLKQQHNEI